MAHDIALGRLALTGLLRPLAVEPEVIADVKLALTEACSNSIRHAYADGRVAYKTAEYVTTSQPPGSKGTVTDRGAHLWVLEKGDDGTWQIVVATWTMM